MGTPYLIGITGCSGSGKTYFLNRLLDHFNQDDICLISMDNYYIPRDLQPVDERGVKNFDTPQSIDLKQYLKDLKKVRKGITVTRMEYTFNNEDKRPQMIEFKPAPIIVTEGIFVFSYRELLKMLDLKIFIEAKDHVRLKRRIIRDNEERGYDLQDVLYRYQHHVIPAYEKYIEPYRSEADIVVPNEKNFEKAMEILIAYLKNKIN